MRFLIDFQAHATSTDIAAYFQQHGCAVLKEWDNFEQIFLVEAASEPPMTGLVERVAAEQNIAINPLDVTVLNPYFGTHRDPAKQDVPINVTDTKDWWKNYVRNQPEFDDATTTIKRLGHGINVYIMDSGIDAAHPEFSGVNITNIFSVTPGDFSDSRGHGTSIASVIAGNTCGITAANLKIVKIFDTNHTTTEHELLDAIDAIINDHVDNTYSVLNASWSIPKNPWVEHKLRVLEDEGVFIVTSAGNNGSSIEDVTPASMIDAITVGAYNQDLVPCDFSNYTGGSMISVTGGATNHGQLDGWAPGAEIWAAGLNGSYGFVAGTSIAAAIASAVLASNLTVCVYQDTGLRHEGYYNQKISTAVISSNIIIFKRPDLLDLSDPRYADSVNLIATLHDRDSLSVRQATDEHEIHFRIGQSLQGIRVYEPTLTKAIEFIQPLPDNFTIIPDGRLYGNPQVAQGPGPGEAYKTHRSSFVRTNLDDSQETIHLIIHVLPENFQPENLPSDDPVAIRLQQNVEICDGLFTFCEGFFEGLCSDYCGGSCCVFNTKGSNPCVCSG